MRPHRGLAATILTVSLTYTMTTPPAAASTNVDVAFEKYELANGLEVILHEDRSTPIVSVNLWYHVGSKNERPGRTGFAHLFEHMMFQGSKHWDNEFFAPLQEAGGQLNGSTNTDRTNYWEVVPSNFLELALWLEADRMGFLLDAMTQEKLDNQRDVVKNERRQNYENRPYGLARGILAEAAYPQGHPYSWLTIGSQEDLTAASLEDVKDFYRAYYTPNNATLVVAGDIDVAATKQLIEKQFGGLEPGPPVTRYDQWVPRFEGEKRVIAQDRVQLPRLFMLWHTVPFFAPDDAELDLLGGVLGSGKNSRLYKALVYERQIAQDVQVYQASREIAGTFQIIATAREGNTLAELEAAIDQEIAKLLADGPTEAEVARNRNRIEADFVKSLQKVGGFSSVSDRLNLYNHYLGDPGFFPKDLARWMAVDRDDVARVAKTYLTPNRLVLHVEPMRKVASSTSEVATAVDRTQKPEGGASPSVSLPKLARKTLANGLELIVVEHHEVPIVDYNLVIRAGSATDPADAHGLASLTASMLDEGTNSRTALEISEALDNLGADLGLFASVDASGATLTTLTKHQTAALAIFAEVISAPSFPADELERVKKRTLTSILQQNDQPNTISRKAIYNVLYGPRHPYGHLASGDEDTVRAIDQDKVEAFYRANWVPGNATLVVVGDTTMDEAAALVGKALGKWQGDASATSEIADASPPDERTIYLVDRPGASQSVVGVAQLGLERSHPDYFAALVTNAALGGMFSSRLNMNLREDKGYTYGARSSFQFRKATGPFTATAGVQTKYTAASITEMLKEIDDIRGGRPLTNEELEFAKGSIVRGFPRNFETAGQIASQLRNVVLHGLPDDYFDTYVGNIESVTVADATRIAKEHLHPERLAIVVVGDASAVREELDALGVGEIVDLNPTGRPEMASR